MVAKIRTFTFIGLETVDVNVEVKLSSGIVLFNIVGLPDKAVNEAKERIRASINSINLSFPAQRLVINLSPADLNKEGSYLDLPMALGLLVEMGVISQESVSNYVVLGELSLDGTINSVSGILPAAIGANKRGLGIICPKSCGSEALLANKNIEVIAATNLLELIDCIKGVKKAEKPTPKKLVQTESYPDFKDIYGQHLARRAAEITAAGGHNLIMVGPPGTGKSMIAERIPGILPDLTPEEVLEVNVINSVAGKLNDGKFSTLRPFLSPHHSCSMPAMVGGGSKPKPGQITLAHNGVLFLDELPEFTSQVLDSLRQSIETGKVSIARATQHITYPANFQLVAAMNPCKCGYYNNDKKQCKRAPFCAKEYQNKISGPLLDRFDIFVDVGLIDIFAEKQKLGDAEGTAEIKKRVCKARNIQLKRYENLKYKLNAKISSSEMNEFIKLDENGEKLMIYANKKYNFSIRGYNKIIRVARTIADLAGKENINEDHVAESLLFRQTRYLASLM
ncbi:MAG: YifB family Mg chelatase-like AAA ATPase [Rickettsiales bacterium]|jgi:magnesium chelatase family protein|nr:YifB family Mg chelatase-like AAA ATPase [Rickettsiales bacterium]